MHNSRSGMSPDSVFGSGILMGSVPELLHLRIRESEERRDDMIKESQISCRPAGPNLVVMTRQKCSTTTVSHIS
jgi:hypothetical protein